ncbi:MAG: SNF2-related protein, partial [Candidatus Omnitrophica bacterium]|nr:SNF2-related protein [Candidatus Omnitrophota bacterium]
MSTAFHAKYSDIVICSYHFARSKDVYIQQVRWDLIIIDEAHRLRNVYKPANRIANAIKNAVGPFPKVLLPATPLQNSLMELYGLVSIIDDHTFGDLILRKLLASSTYAISATLGALSAKLETIATEQAHAELNPEEIAPDYEAIDVTEEEWADDEPFPPEQRRYTPEELVQIGEEVKALSQFQSLARSIIKNSKDEVLLTALKRGFAAATEKGAQKKAIIFAESTRTQEYLRVL